MPSENLLQCIKEKQKQTTCKIHKETIAWEE